MTGKKVRELRKANNLTMSELAKKSGTASSYISDLENGKIKNPSINKIEKIAEALGVSLGELRENNKVIDLTDPKTREALSKIPKETLIEDLKKKIEDINQKAGDAIIDIGIYASLENEMQILDLATDEQIENILNNLGRYLKFELYELKNTIENK